MTHISHIAPTRKTSSNISVILYGSHPQERMTSFGPKCLFKIKNQTILEKQLQVINHNISKPEIWLCANFQLEKLINKGHKIIENQLLSNECEDIRLALNVASHKNILLIDQGAIIDTLHYRYNDSFIVIGNGDEEDISVNINKKVEMLTFNDNDLKWKGITFISEKDYPLFKSCLDTKNYKDKFLFELLNNLIDLKMELNFQQGNGTIITNPKKLREFQ